MEVSHLAAGSHLVGRGTLEKEFVREFRSILKALESSKRKRRVEKEIVPPFESGLRKVASHS